MKYVILIPLVLALGYVAYINFINFAKPDDAQADEPPVAEEAPAGTPTAQTALPPRLTASAQPTTRATAAPAAQNAAAPGAASAPVPPGPSCVPAGIPTNLIAILKGAGNDIKTHGGSTYRLGNEKYHFVYFSAGWCGPCHRFTPVLVELWNYYGSKRDFSVTLVSSDNSPQELANYMHELRMPWAYAVLGSKTARLLESAFREHGIPNLILLDSQGMILAKSYVNGQYAGPYEVVQEYLKRNLQAQ